MVSAQHIIRLIDARSETRRPPLIGMNFLHEPKVEVGRRAQSSPKQCSHRMSELFGSLVGRLAATRRTRPPCAVALRVFTPSGMPAVNLRCR